MPYNPRSNRARNFKSRDYALNWTPLGPSTISNVIFNRKNAGFSGGAIVLACLVLFPVMQRATCMTRVCPMSHKAYKQNRNDINIWISRGNIHILGMGLEVAFSGDACAEYHQKSQKCHLHLKLSLHLPRLQASSSPIPGIRIWSMDHSRSGAFEIP